MTPEYKPPFRFTGVVKRAQVDVSGESMLGLRVEPEFGARNRTEGWTFLLSMAYQLKSLVKEAKQ